MNRPLIFILALIGGFAVASPLPWIYSTSDKAKAAETTAKSDTKSKNTSEKRVRANFNQPRPKKKNYCGYPEEPIQAGMSEFCSFMYHVYCRRGVGCNRYGH